MFNKLVIALCIPFLSANWVCFAQEKVPVKLILRVDEAVSGPYGGQKSVSCLKVYSGGAVVYARRWNSAAGVVDTAGRESRPETAVSVKHQLEDFEVDELMELFGSKALKGLPEKFDPPHRPVDYIETNLIQITVPRGKTKQISTREYYVASLQEKTRYPSALIVLMDRIDEIERLALDKGNPTEPPPDCQSGPEKH